VTDEERSREPRLDPSPPRGMRDVLPDEVALRELPPSVDGCEECLRDGGKWLHLRICLTCGHVGCCDDSPNRHATKHFHKTKHPIMRSLEPGEDWGWCYVDELFIDPNDLRRALDLAGMREHPVRSPRKKGA